MFRYGTFTLFALLVIGSCYISLIVWQGNLCYLSCWYSRLKGKYNYLHHWLNESYHVILYQGVLP